jgi:hypothetical protein
MRTSVSQSVHHENSQDYHISKGREVSKSTKSTIEEKSMRNVVVGVLSVGLEIGWVGFQQRRHQARREGFSGTERAMINVKDKKKI